MDKQTKKRIRISEAAAKKYLKNQRFSIPSLAGDLDMDPAEVMDLFPTRNSVLHFFYTSRLLISEEQAGKIEGYSKFTLSEKLTHFALSLLDQFSEHREFVLLTYTPLIVKNCQKTEFEERFINSIETIFVEDENRSSSSSVVLNKATFKVLFYHFHALVEFWRRDNSRQYENCMAMVDKWAGFTEELFYSKIIDKGIDLAKFLYYQSPLYNLNFEPSNSETTNE